MENSPRYRDDAQKLLSSPSSTGSNRPLTTPTRPVNPTNLYPTTFIHTDTNSFRQVVQMLTGYSKKPNPVHQPGPRSSFSHSIPPIKAIPNKKQSSSSSRLYERRNMMNKHLKINPTHSGLPDIFSPSILDFPSLTLSPVTPLMPDPFYRSGSLNQNPSHRGLGQCDLKPSSDAEERVIKEKGFYIHPSSSTTPRDSEPRLLPLFPVTPIHSAPLPHEP